jgi:hypothetical protein
MITPGKPIEAGEEVEIEGPYLAVCLDRTCLALYALDDLERAKKHLLCLRTKEPGEPYRILEVKL